MAKYKAGYYWARRKGAKTWGIVQTFDYGVWRQMFFEINSIDFLLGRCLRGINLYRKGSEKQKPEK